MKRFLSLFFLSVLFVSASAQITHSDAGAVDSKAADLLKQAASLFSRQAVSFQVTMINYDTSKKETARMTAKVLFNKNHYRVIAPDQELYCDGQSVWHWNKEVDEVVVNPMEEDDDNLFNPAHLLRTYEKQFRAKYIRTDADGTAVIDLQPRQSKSYHKLRLLIREKLHELKGMEIHNYDGSRGVYQISDFRRGVACKDSDFLFDTVAHPDVEVIDMR